MILKDVLREIVRSQQEELARVESGIVRDTLKHIDTQLPHAAILSGIRRCGKSTLLRQLMKKIGPGYYFNFEDPRAIGFELSDFNKLNEVFREEIGDSTYYFFDEIQNVIQWEAFVRTEQDKGKKFFITGSNASLLSKELGTKLTGRHITYELFPFSYTEMLSFTHKKADAATFEAYAHSGGFPEFLKYQRQEILQELFIDILMRDIVARYGLRESKTLKELAIFLLTNIGKEISFTKLRDTFNLGSTNTVISYLSHLEDSYVFFAIPRFSYSYRQQTVNPKKLYAIDVSFASANSVIFSSDKGRVLENLVFLYLRKSFKDISYFKGSRECDFLIKEKGKITTAIQVCHELHEENKEREIAGITEAMETFKLREGTIITMNQEDTFGNVQVIPAWKFMRSLNNS